MDRPSLRLAVLCRGHDTPGTGHHVAVTDDQVLVDKKTAANPKLRTGAIADELLSVTVAGPDLTRADAYATAAFAMGRAGLRWVEALPGYHAAGITHDARLITTRGLSLYRARPRVAA